jgi:pyruvate dehydrogenase (quinone)
VVALVGQQKRMSLGGDFQQEVDLHALFKDVAGEYLAEVTDPRRQAHVVDRAVRIARARTDGDRDHRPRRRQELPYEEPPRAHGALYAGTPGYNDPVVRPADEDLRRAAGVLNAGEKVAILVGHGAKHAADELIEVAELLGAAWPRRSTGAPCCPTTCPSSPAPSACWAPSPPPT